MDPFAFNTLVQDIEIAAKCGKHFNVLQLIGMCEEKDSIFVVLEEGIKTLKQALLDSRALVHYPLYVEKNQTVSSISEEQIFQHLIGIANGMNHLSEQKVKNI